MGSDSQAITIGDVAKIKHGFAFKGAFFTQEKQPNVLVTPGNFAVGGGFQIGKPKYYRGPVPDDYVLSEGDLIVTMTDLSKGADTLGYASKVPSAQGVLYLHNQRVGLVQMKSESIVRREWLHYLMRTAAYRAWVIGSASGTTVKHTSPSRIESFAFAPPPVEQQDEAVKLLNALEERVSVLLRTNVSLEAIAQALFKSWFVDFDPVRAKAEGREPEGMDAATAALFPDSFEDSERGPVPEGWQVDSIYAVADVTYGAPFKSALFNADQVGRPLVRIRDLRHEQPGVWTAEEHPKGYLIQSGDIVVGMDGEFRTYLWGGVEAWLNQRVCVFHPRKPHGSVFLRNAISPLLAGVEATVTATTVIHLGKKHIDEFRVLVPTDDIAGAFCERVQPLYDRVVAAKKSARTLASCRDTLLPRLISGKLRLPDAEREIEAGTA